MEALINKANKYSAEQIKEMIVALNNDFREGADIVFNTLLDILMCRLSEAEFVDFCDELE